MTRQPSMFRGSGLPPRLKPAFDEFWKAYPPRTPNPRALAEAAFATAVKSGQETQDLVAAAANYAAECKRLGTSMPYIVHASTFLTQARFTDYLPATVVAREMAPTSVEEKHALWPALRDRMSAADFRAWIAKCEVLHWQEGESLSLRAPSRFIRNWIRAHHMAVLRSIAKDVAISDAGGQS